MTTPITEEASDEATTALRHLSQRIEVDYQERVAMIDKTCQSMFDWLKTVEPHLSRHENPSSHVVEFEEMVQSCTASLLSGRPEKRLRSGWATTTGATLRGQMHLFKFQSLPMGARLGTSASMVAALPSRQPLGNITGLDNVNVVVQSPVKHKALKQHREENNRQSPARGKVVVGIVKTPSTPNMKTETPRSTRFQRTKTPVGKMSALRHLVSTPKRLFTTTTDKDSKKAVAASPPPTTKRKRVEAGRDARPGLAQRKQPSEAEKPRKRRLAKRSNSGFLKGQAEAKVAPIVAKEATEPEDMILPYRTVDEFAQLRRVIAPRDFAFTSRKKKTTVPETTEERSTTASDPQVQPTTKPATEKRRPRRIARRTRSRARMESMQPSEEDQGQDRRGEPEAEKQAPETIDRETETPGEEQPHEETGFAPTENPDEDMKSQESQGEREEEQKKIDEEIDEEVKKADIAHEEKEQQEEITKQSEEAKTVEPLEPTEQEEQVREPTNDEAHPFIREEHPVIPEVETTALDWGDETVNLMKNDVLLESEDREEISILDNSRIVEREKSVSTGSETELRGNSFAVHEEDMPVTKTSIVNDEDKKSVPSGGQSETTAADGTTEQKSQTEESAPVTEAAPSAEPTKSNPPTETSVTPRSDVVSCSDTSSDRSTSETEIGSEESSTKDAYKRKLEERLRRRKEERASKSRAHSGFQYPITLEGTTDSGLSHTKIAVPSVSSIFASLSEPLAALHPASLTTQPSPKPALLAPAKQSDDCSTTAAPTRLNDVRKSRVRVPEGKRALPTARGGVKRSHCEIAAVDSAEASAEEPAPKRVSPENKPAGQSKKQGAAAGPSPFIAAVSVQPTAPPKPKTTLAQQTERKEKEDVREKLERLKAEERKEKEEREKKVTLNDKLEKVRLNREKKEEERMRKFAEMEALRKKKEEELARRREEQKKRFEEKQRADLAHKRQREAEERERVRRQQEIMEKRRKAEEEAKEKERREKERREREEREKKERLEKEREEKERKEKEERERIEQAVIEKRKKLEEERRREEEKSRKLKDAETLNQLRAMMNEQEMKRKRDEEERRRREGEEQRKRMKEANEVKSKGLSQMLANLIDRGNALPASAIPAPPTTASLTNGKPAKKKTSTELMPPPPPIKHSSVSPLSCSSSPICSSSSSSSSLGSLSLSSSPESARGSIEVASPFQASQIFRNEFQLPTSPARNLQAKEVPYQYPISPYQSSDEEDEDDDPRKPKKRVPTWAQSEQLKDALRKQMNVDPDEVFGAMESPNLQAIFNSKKERFTNRRESGNWTEDRVSWKETREYKQRMQKLREWGMKKLKQQDN